MVYDHSKLLGKIIECYGTQGNFAKHMGFSGRTMSKKINGHVDWQQSEIDKAANLLGIEKSELGDYFFRLKVQAC